MDISSSPTVFEGLGTLGDPTRARILFLLDGRELAVGELRKALQLPQSTVSGHLRVLTDDGWVTSRPEGRSRYYALAPDLDEGAAALWELVRTELAGTAVTRTDRERVRSVLDQRPERSRAFFEASAGEWDGIRDRLYGPRADLLPLFGLLDPSWIVADLGAGTGRLARALAPFVRKVVAVDRSREMLRAAGERISAGGAGQVGALAEGGDRGEDARPCIELRHGELEALPLAGGEADIAVLSLVLHYLVEPLAALREAARILRPGGRLVVVDMRPHERAGYGEEMGHLWPGFEEARLRAWLEAAGFECTNIAPLAPDAGAEGPLLFVASAVRPP